MSRLLLIKQLTDHLSFLFKSSDSSEMHILVVVVHLLQIRVVVVCLLPFDVLQLVMKSFHLLLPLLSVKGVVHLASYELFDLFQRHLPALKLVDLAERSWQVFPDLHQHIPWLNLTSVLIIKPLLNPLLSS